MNTENKVTLNIDDEYPFVYETHLHTVQASACAAATGEDMAKACRRAGYTGIIVTDHFYYGNTAVDRSKPWQEWVESYTKGYEDAYKTGTRIGLQVFFGWESCYQGTEFLIYGLTKEWLLTHPEIKDATIQEQYELIHREGGMVVQAHPYREEPYIKETRLFPMDIDAVETVNACHSSARSRSHNNPEFDIRAKEYAEKYHLPATAGSDIHRTDLLLGGMAFQKKMGDIHDFIHTVLNREPYRLLTGNEVGRSRL